MCTQENGKERRKELVLASAATIRVRDDLVLPAITRDILPIFEDRFQIQNYVGQMARLAAGGLPQANVSAIASASTNAVSAIYRHPPVLPFSENN